MLQPINKNSLTTKIDNLINFYNQNDYLKVIENTKLLIKEYPDNEQLLSIMGITLSAMNQYQESIIYLKKSIQLNPNNAKSYFNIGLAYHELRDFQNAIICYQKNHS